MFYQSWHFFVVLYHCRQYFLFFIIIIIFWISEIERHSTCGTELPCNLWVFWINLVWLKWIKNKKKPLLSHSGLSGIHMRFICGHFSGGNMYKFTFFISFFKKFLRAIIPFLFLFLKLLLPFTHMLRQQSTHVYFSGLVLKSKKT